MAIYLSQGRMVPYVPVNSCLLHGEPLSLSLSLSLTPSVSPEPSIAPQSLSGSIRSRIKLSGLLPPAPKHEGERFSDYSENKPPHLRRPGPSPLPGSSSTGAVYPGSCAQGPRGLTLCPLRATVLQARRGSARVNT